VQTLSPRSHSDSDDSEGYLVSHHGAHHQRPQQQQQQPLISAKKFSASELLGAGNSDVETGDDSTPMTPPQMAMESLIRRAADVADLCHLASNSAPLSGEVSADKMAAFFDFVFREAPALVGHRERVWAKAKCLLASGRGGGGGGGEDRRSQHQRVHRKTPEVKMETASSSSSSSAPTGALSATAPVPTPTSHALPNGAATVSTQGFAY